MNPELMTSKLLPMTTMQSLSGSIDEFVDAVEKLKRRFPNITDDRAMDIVMQLKSMGLPHEVR